MSKPMRLIRFSEDGSVVDYSLVAFCFGAVFRGARSGGYDDNLLDEFSIAELDLLKETTDTLIEHVEQLKDAQFKVGD